MLALEDSMWEHSKDPIAAIGIALTFAVGVWNLILTHRSTRRAQFVNFVTSERIKWIQELRGNVSMFCGSIYTWLAVCQTGSMAQARSGKKQKELFDRLLQTIAADLVPERPGRREPRAVKRRPKPCAWLTQPRHKFKDSQHRNRYWKNNPKKTRL